MLNKIEGNQMNRFIALVATMFIAGCAQIQTYEQLDRDTGAEYTASINDELFRIHKKTDLPNAFGNADLFGGKVDAGTTELRFMGLTSDGQIIFRLTDVDIVSNETTMSRYGSTYSTVNVTSPNHATVQTYEKPEATARQLPPNTVEFLFDPEERSLELKGIIIEVLSVSTYSISYRLD